MKNKKDFKKALDFTVGFVEGKKSVFEYLSEKELKKQIKLCEGKHIQQVVYSSYHNALTQVCFTCKKVRTSLKQKPTKSVDIDNKSVDENKDYDGQIGICYICGKKEGDLKAKNPYYYPMICSDKCEKEMEKQK